MSVQNEVGQQNPRREFMSAEGFVLFNDVTEQTLATLTDKPLPSPGVYQRRFESDLWLVNCDPNPIPRSMVALHAATLLLAKEVPSRHENWDSEAEARRLGLTDEELAALKPHTFDNGIDDIDFAWYFPAAVAASVVHEAIKDNAVSAETVDGLYLSDWAQMISEEWFSEVVHNFARTGWGIYQKLGLSATDYRPEFIAHKLRKAAKFEGLLMANPDVGLYVIEQDTSKQGLAALSASLHPEFKLILKSLRGKNEHTIAGGKVVKEKTDGCPAARHTAMLPEDYADIMPRAVRLQALDWLRVSTAPTADGRVLATQERSAIKRVLDFMSGQLKALEASLVEAALHPVSQKE